MKHITLPSGKRAKIQEGKGYHLLYAQRKARYTDEISYALIAELAEIEGQKLPYEEILMLSITDVSTLLSTINDMSDEKIRQHSYKRYSQESMNNNHSHYPPAPDQMNQHNINPEPHMEVNTYHRAPDFPTRMNPQNITPVPPVEMHSQYNNPIPPADMYSQVEVNQQNNHPVSHEEMYPQNSTSAPVNEINPQNNTPCSSAGTNNLHNNYPADPDKTSQDNINSTLFPDGINSQNNTPASSVTMNPPYYNPSNNNPAPLGKFSTAEPYSCFAPQQTYRYQK